jgi:hypothetical protein
MGTEDNRLMLERDLAVAAGRPRAFYKQAGDEDEDEHPTLARIVRNVAGGEAWLASPTAAFLDVLRAAIQRLPAQMSERQPEDPPGTVRTVPWKGAPERHMAEILYGYRDSEVLPRLDTDNRPLPKEYDQDRRPAALKLAGKTSETSAKRMLRVLRQDLAAILLELDQEALDRHRGQQVHPTSTDARKEFRLDNGMPYIHRVEYERQFADLHQAGSRVFVLNGGLGRTTLGRYLAYQYADIAVADKPVSSPLQSMPDSVVLINAKDPDTLQADLIRTLYRHGINIPAHQVLIHEVFRDFLASDRAPGSVHMDGMRGWPDIADLIPRSPRCTIILTPKHAFRPPEGAGVIFVDHSMAEDDAKELIRSHLPEFSDDDIQKIVNHARSSLTITFIIECCRYIRDTRLDHFLSQPAVKIVRY